MVAVVGAASSCRTVVGAAVAAAVGATVVAAVGASSAVAASLKEQGGTCVAFHLKVAAAASDLASLKVMMLRIPDSVSGYVSRTQSPQAAGSSKFLKAEICVHIPSTSNECSPLQAESPSVHGCSLSPQTFLDTKIVGAPVVRVVGFLVGALVGALIGALVTLIPSSLRAA